MPLGSAVGDPVASIARIYQRLARSIISTFFDSVIVFGFFAAAGVSSSLKANGKVYSGDYLMKVGLDVFGFQQMQSRVIEFVAQ